MFASNLRGNHNRVEPGNGINFLEGVCAQARCSIQDAVAMKEEAAEIRLRLRLERFAHRGACIPREKALEQSLDAAMSVLSADYANIQLVHPKPRGLVLEAQRGLSPAFLNFFAFVNDRHTACGLAFKERRPIVIEDIVRSPIFAQTRALEVLLEAQIRAVKSTPLISRTGRMLGMISVHYRQPRAHIDSDLTRFRKLAAAIADMIDGG
jgi:GAF domain-containing protein